MPETFPSEALPARAARSSRQTVISLMVLACLAAIAAGLYRHQSRMNPAVVNFLEAHTASPNAGAAPGDTAAALFELPAGVAPLTPAEHFDRDSLSEKIDGKAELYLSAGFRRLDCQRVQPATPPGSWVEVFIYDMGSVQNAYAVFSLQRRTDSEALSLAEFAYRAENALFLVHGPYYLEVIASGTDEALMRSAEQLASGFIRSRPVKAAAIAERDLFPRDGLDQASISLIPADAFGVSGLDRVFTATYRLGGAETTAFLSKRADDAEAQTLARSYLEFLKTYGGQVAAADEPMPGAVIVSILDAYEVVFSRGSFLAGVHEAGDRETAVRLARQLDDALKEAAGVR
jgi:hypothetical protein